VGKIETHARLAIGFQIDRARIRLDQPSEFSEESIPETMALQPRHNAQNRQIPMILNGVIQTQFIRNGTPPFHRAGPLTQETADLSTQTRTREREAAGGDGDEATDHLTLVTDHTRNRLVGCVEHQRTQARTIGSDSPPWPGPVNCHVHRIVPKRHGQGFQEFRASQRIGISNGFVYHAQIMLTTTNLERR
jgi:hypothetical protein